MSIGRRISRLEAGRAAPPEEAAAESEGRRELVREQAEHANRCRDRGESPIFEVEENGDVFSARDGRPVREPRQTLAELFYWMEVGWGGPGLVHDEREQAFYTRSGHLALSRDDVDLQHLMGPGRDEH